MEKNIVLLSLEDYNDLRDLKNAIEEDKRLVIVKYHGFNTHIDKYYYTDDEIAEKLKERCDELQEDKNKLEIELNIAKTKMPERKQVPTLEDVKKMDFWQFMIWKRGE